MRKICNLFLLKEGQIAVFKLHNNELTNLTKEGEVFFTLEQDFWQWWQDKTSFEKDENELDLAFVWDEENPLFFESEFFKPCLENSLWQRSWLEDILKKIAKDMGIKSYDGDLVGKGEIYLNSNIKLDKNIKAKKDIKQDSEENLEEETEMYRFFKQEQQKMKQRIKK
ncbi:hypothetical protein DMB92_04050 [Campylobacter sp. MIT 99-7217]|uniref:hypothetical protein n=1 Tax=Campylobacter sp. MIT 99-7217 TaxID=535091 RepID=UPI00115B53A7|nr:hypothetical protein [Campylobacter sp. MIT 99-7217]TQR33137.1 hypothetical protein DMB92_04050 [Campylobacter sp. MIT 99-7217]